MLHGPVPASMREGVQTPGLPAGSSLMAAASLTLDNSYARELEGFSVPWRPQAAPTPKSLFFNAALAEELGFDVEALSSEAGAALFAGNTIPEGAQPIAQAYAGHQFGGFSRGGDGKAAVGPMLREK